MSDPERVIEADLWRATRRQPWFGKLSFWTASWSAAVDFADQALAVPDHAMPRTGAIYAIHIALPASQIADIRDHPQRGSGLDRLEREFGVSVAGWLAGQGWDPTAGGLKLLRRHMAPLLFALAPDLAARGFRWVPYSSRYPLSTQIEWLRLTDQPPLQPVRVR